ncbi:MAG: SDR family oxidoreductase [Rubrobacter sp.]|nr:SDR family oxidoreductase [Rubrobacter sp.]
MSGRLEGRRVLVTHAERYIGPPVVELFREEGDHVIADQSDYGSVEAVREVVEQAGRIDVLVANFAGPLSRMPLTNMLVDPTEFEDEDFEAYFDELVRPMLRFVRAVLPQMTERRSGKIVGATSASPLRAIPGLSVYSAARGAQNAFLQVVGNEAAPYNVQVNALGPAHIANNMYYTTEMLEDDEVRQQLVADIPAGRIGEGREAAELALALASGASDFLAGQVIPVSGGWVT